MGGGMRNLHYDDLYRLSIVVVGNAYTAATFARPDGVLTRRVNYTRKLQKETRPLTSP